jgi:dienelactone hydrolase
MRRALVQAALLAAPILSPAPTAAAFSAAGPAGGRGVAPEVVQIKTEDDQTLVASFYKPASGRAPAVILVHDAGASRVQLEPFAERLSKQGFGVLTLDLRGHGASKSAKLDWAKLSDGDRMKTWSFAPRDVDAAASWILAQPNIHSTSLSLVGCGAGCALAVRHAKRDENVVCMALLAPDIQNYGFDVRADIQALEGLPTYVVTSKDDEAERMALEANASSGNPYIELFIAPPKLATPLEDKSLPTKVSKWVTDRAMPKKGR